jgi:DNA-binding transcriptional MerR regulator
MGFGADMAEREGVFGMRYRIGEFARLSGASIKALRFYDQLGLLQPAAVDPRTRYRLYASSQLQDLAAIRALKDLGASLNDIRRVVAKSASPQERRRLLEKLRTNAEHSMQTALRSLNWIEFALNDLADGECEVPVVIKEQRSAIRVASIRAQVKCYADMGHVERDLQRAVLPEFAGNLQGVLWHRCEDSGAIEGEPFVQISPGAPKSRTYEMKELPSVTVASAYCQFDDEAAVRAYEAISRWVRLHDYRLDGPKREIYVGQILEIQFPVKPK